MADRNFKRVQALDNETKIVAGNFTVSTGTPTKVAGLGWTVAGTGTGEFTVTLDDRYPALIAANAIVEGTGGIDLFAQIDATDVADARTVVINTVVAAVPTATDCTVHFTLILRNSSVD